MTDLGGLTDDIDRLINSVYTKNECKGNFISSKNIIKYKKMKKIII
jgi:hypothetical protein